MEPWHDFFVAVAGASAALTGLIFVGVSLSLTRMLSIPRLADRASEALILLVTVLLVSCLCLAPEISTRWLGSIILIIGIILWLIVLRLDTVIYRATEKSYRQHYRFMIPFNQLAVLPYLMAGVVILNHGTAGVYWLLPAIIFSFMKSVLDAWVILVEIHR
jgi:c-di-AMP phosphodiesterase-like protein